MKLDPEKLAAMVVDTIVKAVDGPRVGGLLAQLEARIAKLETKPFVKFCGTFEGGKSYDPGDAVVHASALWICRASTSGTPSKDFVGWQLALKKGDAGR